VVLREVIVKDLNMSGSPINTIGGDRQKRIESFGADLIRSLRSHNAWYNPKAWPQRFSELVLSSAAVKAQLFRWVDVLPTLHQPADIAGHLYAYLREAGDGLPRPIQKAMQALPADSSAAAMGARFGRWSTRLMASQFIAGDNPAVAWKSIKQLRQRNLAFTADLLGEAVITEAEADNYRDTCIGLIRDLSGHLRLEKERPVIDRDDTGPIPRMNLSIKLSSLTAHFDPLDEPGTISRVAERLRPILDEALRLGAFVHFDMEQFSYKAITLRIIRQILMEPAYRAWPHFGFVSQAYLIDADEDLEEMRDWARARGTPVTVRLVKGAYWDYEVTMARSAGWPVPVWTEKWQSDANYERLSLYLIENYRQLKPAFASHNARSLSHAIAAAEGAGLPPGSFELQSLYGMGDALQRSLSRRGYRVRVYTPYGALLPGMAYLVRRLLENTSNDSFLKAAESSKVDPARLLKPPELEHDMSIITRPLSWLGLYQEKEEKRRNALAETSLDEPFTNEPLTDLTIAANADRLKQALADLAHQCGKRHKVKIGGKFAEGDGVIESHDPSSRTRLLARFPRLSADEAASAVAVAHQAFADWKKKRPIERAICLERAAIMLRQRKTELTALIITEVGKPWREADADVAEAIDFCRYYARQYRQMTEKPWRGDVPGETNRLWPEPRGVVAVIGPWNFPLAIPLGMTAAALVTGNTVVVKPAEQSSWIAHEFVKILHSCGVPENAVIFAPGDAEAGAALVNSPSTAMIVFTGSREVGVHINKVATAQASGQRFVKKVAAEMGGKNAIIIDEDANLDDAVVGVLHSAFGYSGQKCSACSRVIVLQSVYDAFVDRLRQAAESLIIGPASDPATQVGPLVDAESLRRFWRYAEMARRDGRIIAEVPVPEHLRETGYYVPVLIVGDLPPRHALAQEEIFAPILTVLPAADFNAAIALANDVDYALTGAVYSRDPEHLQQASAEFLVGNLYLNRGSTGAMVGRQPFGGMKMSGIGAKTGGPQYLDQFVNFRTITENTMRRGFTPESVAAHETDS
jgi:RHH-type proline utilization regulon transcriptional repressor/proline dehydrogenase/delta 1-pyrroline-5-carboxylate dehydrogenase